MAPEGSRRCELCGAAARLRCQRCRLAYYCDVDHQKADWVSIHEQICQLLIPIRTSRPRGRSEKERKHGMEQLLERQEDSVRSAFDPDLCVPEPSTRIQLLNTAPSATGPSLGLSQCLLHSSSGDSDVTAIEGVWAQYLEHIISLALSAARHFVWDGEHKEAIPAALCALRFSTDVYGPDSVRLVPAYLLLAEASTGAGDLPRASTYLSQAQWVVLRSPGCSVAVQAELHLSLGLFCVAEGNLEQALYHLANNIYLTSSTFGLKSLETSGGYFHMANVFFRQNKMDIANSLYAEVTSIWHAFLLRSLDAQEQILESRLEKAPFTKDKEGDGERMTEAQQAEGIRVLNAVLDVREQAPKQQPVETARVLHALAMLWYLIGDLPKAREVGVKALELEKKQPQQDSPEAVGRLLKWINSKLPYTK